MLARHLQDSPVPPSRRTELAVPAALDRLVLACLAKQPADRPRSAAEVARALDAMEAGAWTPEQAGDWWELHASGGQSTTTEEMVAATGGVL
jgi:serine/threonine-protein kinase